MQPNAKLDFALEFYYNSFYNESRLIVEKLQKDEYTGRLKDLKRNRFKARLAQGIVSFAAGIGILFALWEFCKEICSLVSYPYCY